jgi:hypothetical protein
VEHRNPFTSLRRGRGNQHGEGAKVGLYFGRRAAGFLSVSLALALGVLVASLTLLFICHSIIQVNFSKSRVYSVSNVSVIGIVSGISRIGAY